MRTFDTTGPCERERNYLVPPEPRLPDAWKFVSQGQYFVVHAPRQTGKTTCLLALSRALTAEGQYAALTFSCETGEAIGRIIPNSPSPLEYPAFSKVGQLVDSSLKTSLLHRIT
jgi:hypothetical protein